MDHHWTLASTAFLLTTLAAPAIQAQTTATLNVELSRRKAAVSPTLYGLMTEEINYSYEGGIYAEMVRNRTFRADWSGILYWYPVEKGNAVAKMNIDKATGPSDALNTSMRLDIEKASAGNEAGVLNVGYWGMAVRPNTE